MSDFGVILLISASGKSFESRRITEPSLEAFGMFWMTKMQWTIS